MTKPLVTSADEIKKYFPKYDPRKAEEFHTESAKLADKWLENAVRIVPANIILLAGGSASGKTEYLSQYLIEFGKHGGIFYDGTLPTFMGAKIKIENAIKYKRNIELHFVLPEDISIAFKAFLNRERKFSDEHFYRTHCNARKTVLEIAQNFPQVQIRIIESKQTGMGMVFQEKIFGTSSAKIEFLRTMQYTEKEIIKIVSQ